MAIAVWTVEFARRFLRAESLVMAALGGWIPRRWRPEGEDRSATSNGHLSRRGRSTLRVEPSSDIAEAGSRAHQGPVRLKPGVGGDRSPESDHAARVEQGVNARGGRDVDPGGVNRPGA